MNRTIPLFFLGVLTAILASLLLAFQSEDIFQNPEALILAISGSITKIWMIFFAFSLMLVLPVLGIESLSKRVKPIFLLPISFVLGHATVIVVFSIIKFVMDVLT